MLELKLNIWNLEVFKVEMDEQLEKISRKDYFLHFSFAILFYGVFSKTAKIN